MEVVDVVVAIVADVIRGYLSFEADAQEQSGPLPCSQMMCRELSHHVVVHIEESMADSNFSEPDYTYRILSWQAHTGWQDPRGIRLHFGSLLTLTCRKAGPNIYADATVPFPHHVIHRHPS